MSHRLSSTQRVVRPRSPRPRPPVTAARRAHAEAVAAGLNAAYPSPICGLDHRDPYTLLVATILSAQCTDRRVNLITPGLLARFPTPQALADAPLPEVEALVHSAGFFRAKAAMLVRTAAILVRDHGAQVPQDMAQLMALPGVARKTANVVMGLGFGRAEGVVVDTHVLRLAQRLGLSGQRQPAGVEADLMRLWPQPAWTTLSLQLIEHGRALCLARRPRCAACPLAALCPSAKGAAAPPRRRRPAADRGGRRPSLRPPP